jgi:predicted nucleic acid-binding protein
VILVDTSVWVDHFRRGDRTLAALLEAAGVLMHPFVAGELALGRLDDRELILGLLNDLPQAIVAQHREVLDIVDRHRLSGAGIGYVDAHLVAATFLTPDVRLWTRDRRLHAICLRLGIAADEVRQGP